jgi:hypothetical protein
MKSNIQLGNEVKSVISGFRGIAINRLEYLNGCIQFCVKPQGLNKDGTEKTGVYFDEEQLKVVGPGVQLVQRPGGGPAPAPGMLERRQS